jgi:Amt family ammonium transporter
MDSLWGVWFLIGAALVFFMQCGFAMVETGFTRAKNAGNIIMKNLMDFCIGCVVFILLGYSLMMSEDYFMGIIGIPNLGVFTNYQNFDWSSFVFNLVFCATAATIVSGAMAERTKFNAYCIYSAIISLVVYPIEAGWIWNSQGWLAQIGFIDFAGSCAIHMVGGITALIGAAIVGPRIGKFTTDKNGKKVANAIPGHSLTLGALGVFILWFGWYGFNGAAATQLDGVGGLASIFLTTTLAPGFATVVCMLFTWIRNGKPDVSMCLNASLAGLVGITAGCANMDALGSIIVGCVSGILVVLVVELLDQKLHIDDPVGAVAVHCANGIWGTLAVGLFAVDGGLFYGGGFHQLGIQIIGVLAVGAWTAVTMTIVFLLLKKFNGLRVSAAEEVDGLDVHEHGLANAYADFIPLAPALGLDTGAGPVEIKGLKPVALTTGATKAPGEHKYTRISILCNEDRFSVLKDTLAAIGVEGMTVSNVMGCGTQKGKSGQYRGLETTMNLLPKVQVDIVVSAVDPGLVVAAAKKALYTGNVGDGKIFVYDVEDVVRIRTGEQGYDALQF